MEKQDQAIVTALQNFLREVNRADYAVKNKKEILDKYFTLDDNEDGIIFISVKTSEGDFSHWYTLDIAIDDIDNLFARIKRYSQQILYHNYNIVDV